MTPKKPRPQQSFREWAAEPGRVVVRGELISFIAQLQRRLAALEARIAAPEPTESDRASDGPVPACPPAECAPCLNP